MNSDITKRIEQVQQGIVPEGYQQTKVGIIPNDWKVEKFGDNFNYLRTVSLSREKLTLEKNNLNYNCIHYGDIHTKLPINLNLKKFNVPYVLENELISENFDFLENGDLILADASEDYADIGKSIEIENINDQKVVSGLHTFACRDKSENTEEGFRKYILRNSLISNNVKKIATGISVLGISKGNLSKLDIILPLNREQQKIAEILSTADKQIELKEQLIEKEKKLKKGLMQNLLTGKVRFDGFTDYWQEVKLGKLLKEISLRNKQNQVSRVLSVTNKKGFVNQDEYFGKEIASKDVTNYKIVSKGQFAYNPSRVNVGSIDLLESFEEGILSPMYIIFETKENLNSKYFKYWLQTDDFNGRIGSFVSGSVRDSLGFKDGMCMYNFNLPSLPEQQAIAEVLQAQDNKITLLENELKELKDQKKSLMQLLLTGLVRVPEFEQKSNSTTEVKA